MKRPRTAASWLPLLFLAACAQPPGGFDSPVPSERIRAASAAAERGDQSSIPDLIRLLESDDPLVRMTSIRALERLTGQTLGYEHSAPEPQRQEAIARWAAWHEGR
jgi:hypothetical protein